MNPVQAPRGTRDLLPQDAAQHRCVLDVHARIAEQHGYLPVETPVIEHTELFARGVGDATDVVEKQMFTFEDRGGRSLTLRPEGTAGTLRAALGAHLEQELRPLRLHYAGPFFRAERPASGKQRQFTQLGVECIGERSPHLDAEIIELAWRFFTALRIDGVHVQLNSLGAAEDRARYRGALVAYYTPLHDQLCDDCRRRLRTNPLRLLDCKRDARFVAAAPAITDSWSDASRAFFAEVLQALDDAGVPHTENPRLVRGLDYYTDTVFEFWHDELSGAQNALGGGGRYDGLAELLGFSPAAGTGYSLGVERIAMVTKALGVATQPQLQDVVVVSIAAGQASAAARAARTLRHHGLRVVLDNGERKLDRKLRNADRSGAAAAVIVGEEEVGSGEVTVRDLRAHTQQRVAAADLPDLVQRLVEESR
jgi:histidyl-tRNA synthetase